MHMPHCRAQQGQVTIAPYFWTRSALCMLQHCLHEANPAASRSKKSILRGQRNLRFYTGHCFLPLYPRLDTSEVLILTFWSCESVSCNAGSVCQHQTLWMSNHTLFPIQCFTEYFWGRPKVVVNSEKHH
ncbi:hypothetical protein AMELA_G00229040 [Ameiurus melas]|uniref:Uncharacterized protein n=1 Tax=Ameiurus melas TaxID=219545 RepID=A0A7J5ZX02_AMEME|nr:hypothetical protein AMELA_G00229040 [Ameiurus melas]